ncbi:MAG: nickel-responsive transcriptional regulator NikR [Myxococcota bacterium]
MKESELSRFSVSLEKELLTQFDEYIKEKGYTNRSEAVRDLIREKLISRAILNPEGSSMAAVVMVYNHTLRELGNKLTDIQHHALENIVSALHIHLDKTNCMEVVILKGKNQLVKKLAEKLKAMKGVKHCEAIITSVEV